MKVIVNRSSQATYWTGLNWSCDVRDAAHFNERYVNDVVTTKLGFFTKPNQFADYWAEARTPYQRQLRAEDRAATRRTA